MVCCGSKMRVVLCFLPVLWILGCSLLSGAVAQNPTARVQEGTLVGKTVLFEENVFIHVAKNVDVFLGVPFADPPDRFEPPKPKRPWIGPRDATSYRPACIQPPVASFYFPDYMDEDCLYLNIFAPNPKPKIAPVMVWIHGGGFISGTASTYDFYGVPLVAVGDVVVVTIDYRLGVLGFLSTDDDVSPGNYGMLDQSAALQWVKENIEAFGGDPDQITIFGESAGSANVNFHLLSKLNRDIFNQAILQSGSAFSNFAYRPDREAERRYAYEVGEEFDCNATTSRDLVECLKQIDASRLRAVADRVYPGYSVSVDGVFLTDTPANLYRRGDFKRTTLLTGFNKDEGTIRVYGENLAYAGDEKGPPIKKNDLEESVRASTSRYGLGDSIIQDAILEEYMDWSRADDPDADFLEELVDFHGDFDFICPTNTMARLHAAAGDTVYQYYMTHEPSMSYLQYKNILPSSPWLKSGHTEDLSFVWGIPFIEELDGIHGYNMTADEKALSVTFMTIWTNFAKTGVPAQEWPHFTIPELRYQELSPITKQGRAARARQCHFWSPYLLNLKKYTDHINGDLGEWQQSYIAWQGDVNHWQDTFEDYKEESTCKR